MVRGGVRRHAKVWPTTPVCLPTRSSRRVCRPGCCRVRAFVVSPTATSAVPVPRGASGRSTGRRRRVSVDEVRAAMPMGTITVNDGQESSGASAAVVRRVIREELDAGTITDQGPDPDRCAAMRSRNGGRTVRGRARCVRWRFADEVVSLLLCDVHARELGDDDRLSHVVLRRDGRGQPAGMTQPAGARSRS
jgi:hypothetical protein